MAEKSIQLLFKDGGHLFTQPSISLENVPSSGFVRALNVRRESDQLRRREGWVDFQPNTGSGMDQWTFDAIEPVQLLIELTRPNQEKAVVGCSRTKIKRFDYGSLSWVTIGSGFSNQGRRWQPVILNGYLVLNNTVDLPVTWRVEDALVTPIYELRQVGIASCECIAEYNGFLFIANVREVIDTQLNAIMNGPDPYGPVPDIQVNHIPTLLAWSEFGEPRRWAPIFTVTMAAASATIVLPFPVGDTFEIGTKVAVVNGGPSGGTLGGQEDYPDGVPINNIVGPTLTLAKSTDAGLTYPRDVQVMRWSDVSTLVGKTDIQGDSSAIVSILKLQNALIIYRTKGIYTARYVGTPDTPFAFREKYGGINVPIWRDAIGSVKGEYHLYPGVGGRFFRFDGVTEPELHQRCDMASDVFFENLTYSEECFAVDNPLTKEIWFCRSARTLAFDYWTTTVTEIDFEVGAAALVTRPNSNDKWFILADGRVVCTYALIEGVTPIVSWFRRGVMPDCRIAGGLFHGGDQGNEKDLKEFTPLFSSPSPNCAIEIQLRSTWNANADLEDLLVPPESLPSPEGRNFVTCFFRAIYFQYEISVTDLRDADCRFSGVIYTLEGLKARGVTRSVDAL